MPQILQSGAAAAVVSGVDDIYVLINPPNSVQLPGAPTNIGAAVGTAPWGPLNTPVTIGSGQDLLNNFGVPTTATYDMPTDILFGMLAQGANNLRAVRVSDGTDTAAILKLNDNTGFATGTLTVGGTFSAGVVLTVTINGQVVSYQTQASDTNLAGIAASLAAAINASAAVVGTNASIQPVTAALAVITAKALTQGTAGNSITTTATGTGVTLTWGGGTLLTGAAPAVIATLTAKYTGSYANTAVARLDAGSSTLSLSPTFRLTIAFPNAVPEVYDNIIAYATLGGGYSATTFEANLVKAVNGTPQINPSRPASSYFSAVAGASTASPLLATLFPVSTNGTDGSTFAGGTSQADAAQLGSASLLTGMNALSGQIPAGQFCLSGNTDLGNIGAAAIAFALQENAHFIGAFPTGTSSATAVANKQTWGLNSYAATLLKDWVQFTDTVNNLTPRAISPAAFAVGLFCVTSPETSPANKRVGVITGTERVGAWQNQPYSPAELYLLESNGINLFANPNPGGAYFGLRHNKNSFNADPSRANIAYSTMTKFLAASYGTTLIGQFIGLAQSRQANDPLREKVRAAYNDFNERLRVGGLIDSHTVQCDLRNNSVPSIGSGVMNVAIVVAYMAIVDRIIVALTGGQTVKIAVQPQQLTANS